MFLHRRTLTATVVACVSTAAFAHEYDGAHLGDSDAVAIAKTLDEHHMTLTKAARQAENVSGGNLIAVDCRSAQSGVIVYSACLAGDELWDVQLDEKGALRESGAQKPKADDKHIQDHLAAARAVLAAMSAAKLTFAAAIEAAEKHADGRALVAAVLLDDKTPVIRIHCLVGEKLVRLNVAMDGKVTEVTGAAETSRTAQADRP